MEHNFAPQIVYSETNRGALDRVKSIALHLKARAMRSTPTAACCIQFDFKHLRLHREAAVLAWVEIYRREDID